MPFPRLLLKSDGTLRLIHPLFDGNHGKSGVSTVAYEDPAAYSDLFGCLFRRRPAYSVSVSFPAASLIRRSRSLRRAITSPQSSRMRLVKNRVPHVSRTPPLFSRFTPTIAFLFVSILSHAQSDFVLFDDKFIFNSFLLVFFAHLQNFPQRRNVDFVIFCFLKHFFDVV